MAKEFPSEPKIEKGVYTTPLVKNAPQTTFTVEKDGNILRLTVIELKGARDRRRQHPERGDRGQEWPGMA